MIYGASPCQASLLFHGMSCSRTAEFALAPRPFIDSPLGDVQALLRELRAVSEYCRDHSAALSRPHPFSSEPSARWKCESGLPTPSFSFDQSVICTGRGGRNTEMRSDVSAVLKLLGLSEGDLAKQVTVKAKEGSGHLVPTLRTPSSGAPPSQDLELGHEGVGA